MGTEWYWRSILLHEAHKLICQVYSTLQNWFLCVWFGGFCMKIIVYFVQNLLRLNRERRRKGQNSKKEAFKNSLSSRRRSCIDASGHWLILSKRWAQHALSTRTHISSVRCASSEGTDSIACTQRWCGAHVLKPEPRYRASVTQSGGGSRCSDLGPVTSHN